MLCFGNGGMPDRKRTVEPFTLVKEDNEKGLIHIKLGDDAKVLIGHRGRMAGGNRYFGVMPDSIRVYKLTGTPDLLHIEWCDYMQGEGGYQHTYYMICPKSDPEKTLLRGIVQMSGHGGWSTGTIGSYNVQYEKSNLCVQVTIDYHDNSRKQKPLYHRMTLKNQADAFLCSISTTLTRVFTVANNHAELKSTLLEYKMQEGDTLDDVCKGLKVEQNWILNADLLEKKVSTIQIELPKNISEERYPIIDQRTPNNILQQTATNE